MKPTWRIVVKAKSPVLNRCADIQRYLFLFCSLACCVSQNLLPQFELFLRIQMNTFAEPGPTELDGAQGHEGPLPRVGGWETGLRRSAPTPFL